MTANPASPKRQILVVDDDRAMASVIRSHVSQDDYTVHGAADVKAAIEAITEIEEPYDIAFIDLCLPLGLSRTEEAQQYLGNQLAEQFRSLSPSTRLIAISLYADAETTMRNSGWFSHFIDKGDLRDDPKAALAPALLDEAPKDNTPTDLKLEPPEFLAKLQWVISNWREHRKLIAVAGLIVFVAALAPFFLSDIATAIKGALVSTPSPVETIKVPDIRVKLTNSGNDTVDVGYRGDFFIWLPGPGARHMIGKYEFATEDGKTLQIGLVSVKPGATVDLKVRILNQAKYGPILEQKECAIGIWVNLRDGNKFTKNMPFTKEAIENYYIEFDVARESSE